MASAKKRPKERLIYPVLIIVLAIGLQIYAAISKDEIFPFAPFRMYSYGFSGDNLSLVRIFCTAKDGSEGPVANYRLVKVEPYYTTEIEDILDAKGKLEDDDVAMIKNHTAPLKREIEGRCTALKVYRLHWDHFDGRKRDSPTTKEFILEL
jgi:hypothetical protein